VFHELGELFAYGHGQRDAGGFLSIKENQEILTGYEIYATWPERLGSCFVRMPCQRRVYSQQIARARNSHDQCFSFG
jgi:hypothetical protein